VTKFPHLTLDRPLVSLDLETTGIDPQRDRIVEICLLKFLPDGLCEPFVTRINPGMPIPNQATAIHGITDADVADQPLFGQVVDQVQTFLDGCDLCGFNIKRFDLQLLYAEFQRAGKTLPLDNLAILDTMELFHRYEPRDLKAAVRFYLNREHTHAHSATGDAFAAVEVLDAMVSRYADLPKNVMGIHKHFLEPGSIDSGGKFIEVNGEVRFAFGKYRGQPLAYIAATKPDYLEWMLTQTFFEDTKKLVEEALAQARKKAGK
jgi:DNA polymerase-3 subunit epsilon